MQVLIIDQSEVRRLLPMDGCMEAVADALKALALGEALMPLRSIVWLPDESGGLATMPSVLPGVRALGLKAISVFPGNVGTGLDSHQGVVLLFEGDHGRLQAIMDATEITAIRTAAVSGVATRVLARQDAGDLAILGSGTQARTHLEAMLAVRPIRRLRIWSRTSERAEIFAKRESERYATGIEVALTAQEAVEGADLVCTTTSSPQPVLLGEWLQPGAHVNAIGAVGPTRRELDSTAIARARLYVDRRESAVNEAGELIQARQEGAIGDDHLVAEIGEVFAGRAPGRRSEEEITVFRGVGLAIEDLAAARYVYERAVQAGAGVPVEIGGERRAD